MPLREPRPSDVVVTGCGVVSPVGVGTAAFGAAITSGVVGTRVVQRFPTGGYGTHRAGEVLDLVLDEDLPRSVGYVLTAADEALGQARLDPSAARVGLALGTVMGTRPHLEELIRRGGDLDGDSDWAAPHTLTTVPAKRLGLSGPRTVLCTGCSAGNDALASAAGAIRSGAADAMLAGGADELSETVFAMFTSLRALASDAVRPFDRNRAGLMPAEGAGLLVLESRASATKRGVPVLAEVLAGASASDAHHMTAPHPDGDGLRHCATTVLKRSGTRAADVGYVSAHGTGTPANDVLEAKVLAGVFRGPRRPAVSSIKGMLGHAQGAASAIESVACILALTTGVLPGSPTLAEPDPACADIDLIEGVKREAEIKYALNVAHGFGGTVSAVLFGAGA
ncbi:3-oxoacyl-[acyl-carrier-protein] synthase II [Amycolatopsis xylanica]|uniref:3-oxoacyl-[acyl-carrier-protein] synthase II n=1 Tax=Amycolatopsis xylanica TaxID=589385 RepID=A0A1H2UDW6_9PSEU|nr:beta-ketoacyl-[acyl-carrier-protein] synthase family protein [Amycolatopsis xylanica]SDW54306.1 3-oxoacyl-[acyl-carrier-protein] synthase II [Amycolatopsis xylanica]